ncbi:hypothetical protein [Microbacterium sp. SLBN-111]|uniref:hypothetical protein n=1 Tax=Microbacterium sp. SLBN-111 TaxID=3377733 RepID=UPI003C75725D
MSAIWVARTRPRTPGDEADLIRFLNTTHTDELHAGLPELAEYRTFRRQDPDGRIQLVSIGRCPSLSGAELIERMAALAPGLTQSAAMSFEPGEAPSLEFAEEV